MTSSIAIIIAWALILNNIPVLYSTNVIIGKYPESKLIFLTSVCFLLRRISWFPSVLLTKVYPICLFLEIPLSLLTLECSLVHVWKPIEELILLYSDDILVQLNEKAQCEWIICSLCCGQTDCSHIFSSLMLKMISFIYLLTIYLIDKKI
ncbi:uncharacterized protein LOC116775330 [Danaus plexippus]|uniref:uncharacterized protein LOC116775330 n=1 Tax=Danaus plexippus TaxID=13037 RepID=UPI002AB067DA|nr:uncharacterized protein LOC116775330 [Danaus plexippus]